MSFLYVLLFSFSLSTTTFIADPLEQFDVLSLALPLVGGGVTNLSLLLAFNILVIAFWLSSFHVAGVSNYDFGLRSLYGLVRSMVDENLYVHKQQYFSVIFYLFLTLMIANLVGMVPYSFTITSSFIVTFFLALTHFIGINVLAAVKHK